jgi:NAD(P)-dependent dehydrogenase (short-subunit alcohol dehydrogenase family)
MTELANPFNKLSTASDVVDDVDLSGRRIVVTGGGGGIGRETARALAAAGADVTIAVRRLAPGLQIAAELSVETKTHVRAAQLDLSDRTSIAEFAHAWAGPLDVLINNAGVMAVPQLQRTKDGWELHYATNYLGPAELILGLAEALAAGERSRVVNVSSGAHLMSPVDFDDPHFHGQDYGPWTAYARSKTAIILFSVALASRWESSGVSVNALHPGGIKTDLFRHLDDEQLTFVGAQRDSDGAWKMPSNWKTIEQGAATSVLLAASPFVEGVTGRYFEDCQQASVRRSPDPRTGGVAWYAIDPDLADRIWNDTLSQLGTRP